VQRREVVTDAGNVGESINASLSSSNDRIDVCLCGNVTRDRDDVKPGQVLYETGKAIGQEIDGDNTTAFTGDPSGGSPADARRCPGDHDGAVRKPRWTNPLDQTRRCAFF
jgi:hypothetical protein